MVSKKIIDIYNLEHHVIKFLSTVGVRATDIHQRMLLVYGVGALMPQFKHGRKALRMIPGQEGLEATVATPVAGLRIKIDEISTEVGISHGSVTIIHEYLGKSKVSARWVPKHLGAQD